MLDAAAQAAVTELAAMLRSDGYDLVAGPGEPLELCVVATEGACAECLVPKAVMETVVRGVFAQHGAEVPVDGLVLRYPGE